jgi:L-lactate dehydrogenase complex protein LldE
MAITAQLFITCRAEQFFPDVLKRMVGLLERLGVQVKFPEKQTCCGRTCTKSSPKPKPRVTRSSSPAPAARPTSS